MSNTTGSVPIEEVVEEEEPVVFPDDGSVHDGTDGKERVVHDEDGGWHKEAAE